MKPALVMPAPAPCTASPRAASVCLRWEIAPDALIASPAAAATLNGHAASLVRAWLEWRIDPAPHLGEHAAIAEPALVALLADRSTDRIALEGARVLGHWRSIGPTASPTSAFDVDQLSVVSTDYPASPRLLYAWTGLLAGRFGLRGGVYDVPDLRCV